jgi:hypothetical protein
MSWGCAIDVVQHLGDHEPLDASRCHHRGRGSTEVVRPYVWNAEVV